MAERDTDRWKVRRALETAAKKRTKQTYHPEWYRQKPRTINAKLRQAIIDCLPFGMDIYQADLILETIFRMIVEGVTKDGKVTIPSLGRFYIQHRPPHRRRAFKGNTYVGLRMYPAKHYLAFQPCKRLMKALIDPQ
jgi:nucleoid DNA-binding protein